MQKVMRDYQRRAFYYCGRVEHPALFHEMRLGKTLVTIRRTITDFPNLRACLIVAPYSALYGWKKELLDEGVPLSDITELQGTAAERLELLAFHRPWVLFNKEGFLSCPDVINVNWQTVILDESTFVKDVKTKVSKFYTNNFRSVQRRWILTGTPCPESELDLFQQLRFLDPTILGISNYYAFRHRFFIPLRHDFVMSIDGINFLKSRTALKVSVLSRADVHLDVKKIYSRRMVELPAAIRAVYNTIEKEFILEIKGKILDETVFAMEKFIWLRRVCGGMVQGKEIHRNKLNELLELFTGELKGKQAVVYCAYVDEVLWVTKELTGAGILCVSVYGQVATGERDDIEANFQNGTFQVIVHEAEMPTHGRDFASSDINIYFSTPLGNERRQQSEDRIIRLGKTGVYIMDVLVNNSIEEDIYNSLLLKETRQELIRRIMKRASV